MLLELLFCQELKKCKIIISGSYSYSESLANLKGSSPETWEIIDKQNRITVMGKEYQNVVVVKRTTLMPSDIDNLKDATLTYWVAKGIGMVNGIGQYELMGEPLTIELIETNLVQ
jgi:hypothetical protein